MNWTGKLIGGAIGSFLGPIGAAVGVLLGHQYDERQRLLGNGAGPIADAAVIAERFFRTTFEVMGHVAKMDGRVSEREIAAARSVMAELHLDPAQIQAAIAHFTAGKQPGFSLHDALEPLRQACGGRGDLLRAFVEIQMRAALAGNDLAAPARQALQRVADALGISRFELAHIEAVLRIRSGSFARSTASGQASASQLEAAYRVLEVPADARDEELAKAYRRQLSRHHPDKLKANGLPESMIEHAKERTQTVIEAYELVKREREKRS